MVFRLDVMSHMSAPDLASHTAAQTGFQECLYKQVALRISELIEHGTLRPGERVPSVRRYSRQQNVSIATVTQAYRLLEDRGLIQARPQSGYYVRVKRWAPPSSPGHVSRWLTSSATSIF